MTHDLIPFDANGSSLSYLEQNMGTRNNFERLSSEKRPVFTPDPNPRIFRSLLSLRIVG